MMLVAVFRPGYLTNAQVLGGLVFVELLIACLWRYRTRFFPALMIIFLLAGAATPFQSAWTAGRWLALLLAALAGMGLYMKESGHRFHPMDMAALFSTLAAFVSAAASAYPKVALLKALSLFLLFLFAVTGARFSVKGHESSFMNGLVLALEALVYLTAASYLVADFKLFGNPNSLGAIMGVMVVPILFWSTLIPADRSVRRRRIFALLLALFLLLFSLSRASILAGLVSVVIVCLALRRYQVLMKGVV